MQEVDLENPTQAQTQTFRNKKNKKSRILLVEDDMISRKVMQYMIENVGCDCDTVITGEEALTLFKEKEYDLVFMDHGLPGELDGEQTAQHIRACEDELHRKDPVPIIMVSAHLFYQDHPQMYEAGCTHIINKPLRPDQLKEIFEYYGLFPK